MHIKSLLPACTLYIPLTLAGLSPAPGYEAMGGLAKNGCDICKTGYGFEARDRYCDMTTKCCVGMCRRNDGKKG
ncbi:uncharacterized protein B0J16DRAFT_349259 [Fusarium flagelliforme]|uniref:uncharacterized protein n=1 Tax=Fusarium flagelliforme TaxID=2675880 RepID=UPI001E8D2365|nr:uncharacterized protein B0J16DRAFT_349259 [Fusarium flagelliforme]KAH7174838.1 hypothetical protein B0J16DRAFT_349259 [Fusarium flagelliforme]